MSGVREQTYLSPAEEVRLPPFPEGWYFIASHRSLRRKKLISKTWMGRKIVAWSDAQGRICVAEAFCPHLGSELAPEVGAQVRNGCLVCPFHGFEYATDGRCVATPHAPPPPTARLSTYTTRVILGMVFAWYGSGGRPPQWRLPSPPSTGAQWSSLLFHSQRFPGHPQETTENAVDLAHLRYVHGYDNVGPIGAVEVDGAYLKTGFNFRRTRNIAGIKANTYDVSAMTHIYGLGYSYVEITEKSIGMRARLWVLATPVDGRLMEMTLVSQVRELRAPKRPIAGLRFMPLRLRHRLMNRIVLWMQQQDVLQDVILWSRKQYRARPLLNSADGEVVAYRRYCRQFYPEPTRAEGGATIRHNTARQTTLRPGRPEAAA